MPAGCPDDEDAAFARYLEANRYLNEGLIRREPPPHRPCGRTTRQRWMSWLLPALGHPERAFGAVHVAGTSGKGSVATITAELLRAAGLRTGLHVTPYLQVATEKLWIDGRYASVDELAALVDWIRPLVEPRRGPLVPMHGMAWVGLTLEHFRRQQVDIGVIEVGVGGRHDLTNVLDTRVAVIAAVGLDHLKTLGPTIEHIAAHKAGVIRPGCRAVVLDQGAGLVAARRQAATVNAPLRVVSPGRDFAAREADDGQVTVDFHGRVLQLEDARLGMAGRFQAENAALALAAVEELGVADRLDPSTALAALARARLPGRAEPLPPLEPGCCPVLVDGAHNPDKLAAFEGVLEGAGRRRQHIVYGCLGSHTDDDAVARLVRRAATFVATEPRVYAKGARPAAEVAEVARAHARAGTEVLAIPDAREATRAAIAGADASDLVVVTGSLYLVGEVRGLWYPDRDVLCQRSSWPARR